MRRATLDRVRVLLVVVPALISACVGTAGDGTVGPASPGTPAGPGAAGSPSGAKPAQAGTAPGAAPGTPPAAGPDSASCAAGVSQVPVPARVRRLTAAEYQATLIALAGPAAPVVGFPKDPVGDLYANHADSLRVTSVLAQNLWNASPRMAAQATQALLLAPPCKPTVGANNDACAQQILTAAATRAYRRPAAPDEIAELMDVYRVGINGTDFATGLTTAMRVVVQSAEMLYHTELGSGATAATKPVMLTPHEIANQLAYLTTGGPPDSALTAAADAGMLASADVRVAQAARLLGTPGARPLMGSFATQWLGTSGIATPADGDADSAIRDAKLYPNWSRVRASAATETQAFFARAVLDENATLATLFTADWTTADATMISFYGAKPADASGRVTLPAGQRAGVLTQAAVLASRAHVVDGAPIQRGYMVATRLLCNSVPPPDASLNITVPPPDPTRTTRQIYATHASDPACRACHAKLDPMGFGFENFDAIGRYRTTDNKQPVDATGTLLGSDVDGPFNGPVELVQRLSGSRQARDCFTQQWFEFALAQIIDDKVACGVRAVAADFIAGKGSVRDLVGQLVRSDMFVMRAAAR